ncbi:MAG: hypothetical protein HDR01_04400 [Lachnospiraceae bacterium]|nr:hypothetical protein [Lachnospiraceae bacterium]
MSLIKNIKKQFLALAILGMVAINLSGCVYANNKNWNDLTAEGKEELQQEFESMKVELEEDFPSDSADGKFTSYILDKVEKGMED